MAQYGRTLQAKVIPDHAIELFPHRAIWPDPSPFNGDDLDGFN